MLLANEIHADIFDLTFKCVLSISYWEDELDRTFHIRGNCVNAIQAKDA